jgi:hypothetical protein
LWIFFHESIYRPSGTSKAILTAFAPALAEAFITGEHLNDIAESSGITKGTARYQLKAIFSKTNTHTGLHSQEPRTRKALAEGGAIDREVAASTRPRCNGRPPGLGWYDWPRAGGRRRAPMPMSVYRLIASAFPTFVEVE